MDIDRYIFIDRIFASNEEFTHPSSLYNDLFYAFSIVQHMSILDVHQFYPWLPDPIRDAYKLDTCCYSQLCDFILQNCTLSLLESITSFIENQFLTYDSFDW